MNWETITVPATELTWEMARIRRAGGIVVHTTPHDGLCEVTFCSRAA